MIHGYWAVFGVLTILGGVIGFVRAQSKASLIAGGISGGLLLVAFFWSESNPTGGHGLGLGVSLLLFGRFLGAYLKTRKPMPAIPMIVLGGIGVAGGVLRLTGVF